MSIKKDFFAPWALGLGATRRAAMLLLVMMLTTATAWADNINVETAAGFGTLTDGKYTLVNGNTYTLTGNINTDGYIYVPEGVTATIDLAGHTIDRGLTSADNNGTVIIVAGTLTITDSGTDGKIQGGYDGYAEHGFYVSGVEVQNGATFNLQGGTLVGRNQVYDYTVAVYDNGSFTMTGGKITEGWTGVQAGGNVTLTGGEISGNSNRGVLVDKNFSISGNPVITGNTNSNVYLAARETTINITGALTEGANIGITAPRPTDNSPVTVTSGYGTYNSEPVSTYFSLDNNGQIQISPHDYMTVVMGWNEDKTEIAVGTALYTVNFDMNGHGDAIDAVSLLSGYKVAEPTKPTADDWFFVGWFTDDACTSQWNFNNAVTSNMTLHALWTQEAVYSFTLPEKMVIVSTTNAPVGGKYPVGTVIKFKVSSADYVVDGDVSDGTNTLTPDGDGNYTITMGDADITITATIKKAVEPNKTLSGSENYKAQNGDVLTGSTSGTVTIASGANVTLSDVTITGGIVCAGTAEITLVGTNSVTAGFGKAGIQVGGSDTKLTIKGNGSLTANGGGDSAGIGLSRAWTVDATGGDIVIEGGNITATGDGMGAGIGTGVCWDGDSDKTARLGNITIKGGTVRAIGGTNNGNGIGKGHAYVHGHAVVETITIYDTIDKVDASSISESVTYMHVENETETDVTANKSDYFTITEDGNRRVIEPKDDTDYTITIANGIEHGTLTGAATAKYTEKVTITATPAFGYRFSRLVVKDAQNNAVASTDNSFFMPKSDVTVSAVFEQGTHGTTEFAWGYQGDYYQGFVTEATIYDGVTTVNLQQGKEYNIGKDYHEDEPGKGHYENTFRLDEDPYTEGRNIPYSGGTGSFMMGGYGKFRLNGDAGYYDITMTDVGNGKWNVSILKTAGQMDVVPDQTYTGSEIKPEPLVIAGSLSLTKGTDYTYSYMNNTDEGTQAKVTVNFLGDYAWLGSVERTFNIICEHTITYDLAGGTVATENPTTYTIVSGDITLTTPTREGYTFTGWTGTDLTEPTMTVTIASGSTGDRQYTATWTMTWANVKAALQAGQSVTLANDVTRVNSECIEPSGTVTLDLNGYTIDGGTTQTNPLFRIDNGVSLTITDSQTGGNLCNAGQNATVSVNEGGSLTLAGGTINAQASGVFMWGGNFNMTGGTITGGSSNGVYLNGDNVSFTMTGGTITCNEVGVGVNSANATFIVSGNVNITGNTMKDVNLKYSGSNFNPIMIGGKLASTARIGVYTDLTDTNIEANQTLVFTDGLKDKGTRENFVRNNVGSSSLFLANLESGEMAFSRPFMLHVPDNVTVNELTTQTPLNYNVGCGDVVTLLYGADNVSSGCSLRYIVPNGAITYLGAIDAQGKCAEFTMPGSNMTITRAADNNYSFGGITLKETFINGNSQGQDATFDGSSQVTIDIPENIAVNSVTYNRTFTMDKPSTVMLPFSKDVGEISGGTFYTFGGVEKKNNKWEATMNAVTVSLTANTPYLFVPAGTSLTFTGGATLNTTGGGNSLASDTEGWEFHGTYSNKVWDEVETHDYGFAATSGTSADDKSVEAGQFVHLTTGASAKPMRCYLSYVGSNTPNAGSNDNLVLTLPKHFKILSVDGQPYTGNGQDLSKGSTIVIELEAGYKATNVEATEDPIVEPEPIDVPLWGNEID